MSRPVVGVHRWCSRHGSALAGLPGIRVDERLPCPECVDVAEVKLHDLALSAVRTRVIWSTRQTPGGKPSLEHPAAWGRALAWKLEDLR